MAVNKKFGECTELTVRPADDDILLMVDISDPTDDPTGTSKFIGYGTFFIPNKRTVSGTDSADPDDDVVFLDPTSAAFTFTLGLAADRKRQLILINIADPSSSINVVTIEADGTETIGPTALNYPLNPGERITILPRTSAIWEIIS